MATNAAVTNALIFILDGIAKSTSDPERKKAALNQLVAVNTDAGNTDTYATEAANFS